MQKSRRLRLSRRRRVSRRKTRAQKRQRQRQRRRQHGGDVSGLPSGYPDMPVSYTPKAADGDIGDPDMVPRVGTLEEFKTDAGIETSPAPSSDESAVTQE